MSDEDITVRIPSFKCDGCGVNVPVRRVTCGACVAVRTDMVDDVAAFAAKFELTYEGPVRVLPRELGAFRRRFLDEEVKEYSKASVEGEYWVSAEFTGKLLADRVERGITHSLESCLDACIDEIYVAIGTLLMHGFKSDVIREAWRRVQNANMAKERASTPSERGGMYDVVKPSGWTAPSHTDLCADHAHKKTP